MDLAPTQWTRLTLYERDPPMSSLEDALSKLPKPILDKLQSMIRRIRRLLFLRGLCATLAVALIALLVIMSVDAAVTLFSTAARWALSLVGLGATTVAAWWFLYRPLSRPLTLTHMARILEIRHPELQERISTAVELLSSDDPDSIRGSEELINAVVDSAVIDVAAVDPKTEFKPVRSRKFILAAAIATGIILLLFAVWPKQSWTLVSRAFAPFLDIGNAYADSLVVDPGNIRVAKGQPVTIQVSVKHKRLKRAEIRKQMPDGSETVERMSLIAEEPDGTKRFSLTFPGVNENFHYRVRAGSALSEFYDVKAINPPIVEGLSIHYHFPEYTGLPDRESSSETGEIRAVAHTQATVVATVENAPWTAIMLLNEKSEMPKPVVQDNEVTWNFELKGGMRGSWEIQLSDEEGFTNDPVSYPIEVLPDKAPTVQIVRPTQRDLRLKPTERLPIDLSVIEDFGFTDVTLLITPDGAVAPIEVAQALPEKTDREGNYHALATLNLPTLKLQPEQVRLAVQVQVRDNRPVDYDGPGIGLSEVIFVTLDQNAKSIADQAIEEQKQEVDQKLREAKQELERARDDIRRTEQELNRTEEMNDKAAERLNEFSEHNKAAREKLNEVAATLDNPLFGEQSKKAKTLANETLAAAQEKADLVPVTDGKKERVAEAKEAREKVEGAIKDLDNLANSLREAQKKYEAISKLNALASRQQELAMNAEKWAERAKQQAAEMPPQEAAPETAAAAQKQFDEQQKRERDQFQNEQNRVEQQLGEMLKDNAAALSEVLEQQRKEATTLAEQAEALAENQEALQATTKAAAEKKDDSQAALKEAILKQLEAKQAKLAAETEDALKASQAGEQGAPQPAEGNQPKAEKPATPTEAAKEAVAESVAESAAESLAAATKEAAKTAENLSARNLPEAAKSAIEASQSLAEAAAGEKTPANPENANPASNEADAATETKPDKLPLPKATSPSALAVRQEAISKQIAAVNEGNLQEALSLMETEVNAGASALEAQAKAMAQSLQNLQQNQARAKTGEAQKALNNGAREAAESSNQLKRAQDQQAAAAQAGQVAEGQLSPQAKATMQQGQKDQQQSAQALAQAAKSLAQTAESIGQTMEGLDPSDAEEGLTKSEDLAEGFNEVSESSKSQNAKDAADQSQEAANALQKLAQQAMQKLGGQQQGKPGDPNAQPQEPNQDMTGEPDSLDLNETGKKTGDSDGSGIPPELANLGLSAEDWARFKGALVGGNASAIETDLPAEYRELVGRYFQVIAKEAGKKP